MQNTIRERWIAAEEQIQFDIDHVVKQLAERNGNVTFRVHSRHDD